MYYVELTYPINYLGSKLSNTKLICDSWMTCSETELFKNYRVLKLKCKVFVNNYLSIEKVPEVIFGFREFNAYETSPSIILVDLLKSSNIIRELSTISWRLSSDKSLNVILSDTDREPFFFELKDENPKGIWIWRNIMLSSVVIIYCWHCH